MSESNIQAEILRAIGGRENVRLFRNQVGCVQSEGRWIRYGLTPGSADLVGWQTVTVTPDMVGRKLAVFTSIEVKGPHGKLTPEQDNWRRVVTNAGGAAGVARSVAEAEGVIVKNDEPTTVEPEKRGADSVRRPCSALDGYMREIWRVEKDVIYAAIPAVESGLEYARECLTSHKNKTWAETMERDIRHMERTLAMLRACGPNDKLTDAAVSDSQKHK